MGNYSIAIHTELQTHEILMVYYKLHSYHLEVGDADIEGLVHVGVPHHTHIGDVQDAKVALETCHMITYSSKPWNLKSNFMKGISTPATFATQYTVEPLNKDTLGPTVLSLVRG